MLLNDINAARIPIRVFNPKYDGVSFDIESGGNLLRNMSPETSKSHVTFVVIGKYGLPASDKVVLKSNTFVYTSTGDPCVVANEVFNIMYNDHETKDFKS